MLQINYTRKSWGQYLRTIRLELQLTIKDIAELYEISPCRLSEYECGKRLPTAKTLDRITTALNSLGITTEATDKLKNDYQKAVNSSNNSTIGRIRREIS